MVIHYKDKEFFNGHDLTLSVDRRKLENSNYMDFVTPFTFKMKWDTKNFLDMNQCMLIRRLRELEEDKIITRCVYPIVPPKVEYELNEIGYS